MVAGAVDQGRRLLVGDDPAVGDDDGPRADGIHLLQDVGGDDDHLVGRHGLDQLAHLVLLVRVEAVGGLVQDQHRRVVQDGLGQADAAAKALGQRLDGLLQDAAELQPLDHVGRGAGWKSAPDRPRTRPMKARKSPGVISP